MLWASDLTGRVALISEDWQDITPPTIGSDASGDARSIADLMRVHADGVALRAPRDRKARRWQHHFHVRRGQTDDFMRIDLHGIPARSVRDGSFSGYLGTAEVQNIATSASVEEFAALHPDVVSIRPSHYLDRVIALLEEAHHLASAAGDRRLSTVMDFALKVSLDRVV